MLQGIKYNDVVLQYSKLSTVDWQGRRLVGVPVFIPREFGVQSRKVQPYDERKTWSDLFVKLGVHRHLASNTCR